MDEFFDVVIVGTGAAGLYCALNLPERMTVLLLTKKKADESDSFLAQGGICMLRGEEDFSSYMEDTLRAGHILTGTRWMTIVPTMCRSIPLPFISKSRDGGF